MRHERLADLLVDVHIHDEPSPAPEPVAPECCLVELLDKLHIVDERASDVESVGSSDPPVDMIIDLDAEPVDTFPKHVVIIDDPLPAPTASGAISTVTEVLVTNHDAPSGRADQDPLEAALQNLAAPVAAGADDAVLEALRVSLLDSANKLAASRRLTEAYCREMDRAICGTSAAGEPSRAGAVRNRGELLANMLGAPRPVYLTPSENLRVA